jgi:predicted glycoside hydrolase/deacetylase ChbG (UPF0249 family)
MKKLIINADDFGYSSVFNAEILRLLEGGLISSTTVMVDYVGEEQTAQIKKLIELNKTKDISVGLHLEFLNKDFLFEIERQYKKFVDLFCFEPSHIDLHKYAYLDELNDIILKYCEEKNLPHRNHISDDGKIGKTTDARVVSGTKMNFEELKNLVENFEDKSYEIFFHPGKYDPESKSSLNKQREDDVRKIEKLKTLLIENNIQLISFKKLV